MNDQERRSDKRAYQRGSHFHTDAQISLDNKNWKKAEINDLSSGGLQLYTNDIYEKGDLLWFNLKIQGFFSHFEIKVQGSIRRVELNDDSNIYGISFKGLKKDLEILIDENVQNDRPLGRSLNHYD